MLQGLVSIASSKPEGKWQGGASGAPIILKCRPLFMKTCKHIPQPCHDTSARNLSRTSVFVLVLVLSAPAFAFGGALRRNQKPISAAATEAPSSASARQSGTTPQPFSTTPEKRQTPTNSTLPQSDSGNSKSDSGNSKDDYKNSLKELSSLFELDAKRLTKENSQLKELYAEGLIARVELEASDKSLAEAQAKVEAVRKQIAEASLKPEPLQSIEAAVRSDQTWTTGSKKIDNLIRYYGKDTGVDPYLIFCLMSQESSFGSHATSPKGAQGLMQLMPATAARYGVTNPYDSAQSIMGGARYLKDLLQLFGRRLDLALAGYNAGENAVIKYGYKIPPYAETKAYVRLISARYAKNSSTVSTTVCNDGRQECLVANL